MDFDLTPEQRTLHGEIVRFSKAELNADVITRDKDAIFRRDLWVKCAAIGLPGLSAPVEFGGSGFDCLTTAVAAEALGYGCTDGGLVFSLLAHLLTCVAPIARYGTDEQKRRYLPGLCDGSLVGGNAMSEPGSGSDAFTMATGAVRDGDGFVLTGSKTFSTNAPVADLILVFALTSSQQGREVTSFLLDPATPGVEIGKPIEKSGLRTSPMAEVRLDDVRLPAEAVLGGVGGGPTVFAYSMNWERICLFAAQVGVMQRLHEQAVDYARVRKQFGKPIGHFQAVSHTIADNLIRLNAARLLVYEAAWKMDNRRNPTLAASSVKVLVSETFQKMAADTVRIFGGYGFTTEYGVERIYRDAIASTIYSGTNEMQKQIIARLLGLRIHPGLE